MKKELVIALSAIAACIGTMVPFGIGWSVAGLSAARSATFWCRDARCEGFWQLASGANAMTVDGLVTILSVFGPKETMDRLEREVKAKGLTVFARVDHAAGAQVVGLKLRPTELLIFGNAKGGTPLMEADQRIGIDLPLKALVYQDEAGKVWLAYTDPSWLARRYGLGAAVAANVEALSKALGNLAAGAAKSP
jgi:uncharacterized protein (DUF302 family)